MFMKLRGCRAQSVSGEYLLIFFLVVAVISSMTIYAQRALQARFRDVRLAAVAIIRNSYQGTIYTHYEPYYANTISTNDRELYRKNEIFGAGGGITGVFTQTLDEVTASEATSLQLPPRDAR